MRLKIEIDMDNAAFEDNPGGEIRRILTEELDKITEVADYGNPGGAKLFDENGNCVGYVRRIGKGPGG